MLIIHGDNQVASRKRLTGIITGHQGEIIRLEGKALDLTILKQNLESGSLFGQDRLVVIENLFSQRQSQLKDKILSYLKTELPKQLIVWEGKKVDGRTLASFAKAKVEKFIISPKIFTLMDSLIPGNSRNLILLCHQALENEGPELIFFLLERQIRQLIIGADLGEKGLTEAPFWKKSRIVSQAKKFKLNQLIFLYQKLLQIEYQQKTGKASLTLASQLDLWLANL